MKLNHRLNAIHLLEDGSQPVFSTTEDTIHVRQAVTFMHNVFPAMRSVFRRNIQYMEYVSEPLCKAYAASRKKQNNLFLKEPVRKSGTLIQSLSEEFEEGSLTVFYDVDSKRNEDNAVDVNGAVCVFLMQEGMPEPELVGYIRYVGESEQAYLWDVTNESVYHTAGTFFLDLVSLLELMKYYQPETKLIPAGKTVCHAGEKYENETKRAIEILELI